MQSLVLLAMLVSLAACIGFTMLIGLLAYAAGVSGWTLVGSSLLGGIACTFLFLRLRSR